MKQFEILDHPADIGLIAYGKSIEELFTNALLGTTCLMVGPSTISGALSKNLQIKGKDPEELFINFLDEVIFLFDSEGFLTKDVIVEMLHATSLRGILKGEKYNPAKHKIKLYLKAVTYHQLEIKKTKDGLEAKVYFDV